MKIPLCLALFSALCVSLPAQTSATNGRLKKALERFPEADADKDGVLTVGEAKAYKAKWGADREAQAEDRGKGAAGGRAVVYKTVGGRELMLHIHRPEQRNEGEKLPAAVFFHGGGWRNGTPAQFGEQCRYLASRGMVAVTVEYRLTTQPGVKIEDCVEDARSAMRWVRGHADDLGIDPDRIASGGGSAGGHLGACVQLVDTLDADSDDKTVSAKPNAMILFNPAMALDTSDPRLGKGDKVSMERAARLSQSLRGEPAAVSPLTFAKTKQPPCIMFFGTEDTLLKSAEWFRDDSIAAGNNCRIVTYEGEGHSFFNRPPYTEETLAEVDRFLTELGWLEKK